MPIDKAAILATQLKNHIGALSEEIGPRHVNAPRALHKAANYISHQWQTMGYRVEVQPFSAMGVRCMNLEAERKGRDSNAPGILLVAHYDTVRDCPGANNAASGIASLLEISRAFSDYLPRHSLRFVALSNESPPFLGSEKMGSWIYAHQRQQGQENIKLVIRLDSLGYYNPAPDSQLYPPLMGMLYPGSANFLAMSSHLATAPELLRFHTLFKKHSDFPCCRIISPAFIPYPGRELQTSFRLHGYPSLVISDTARYRYPFYQSRRDTAEKIDYPALVRVTDALCSTLAKLSGAA